MQVERVIGQSCHAGMVAVPISGAVGPGCGSGVNLSLR